MTPGEARTAEEKALDAKVLERVEKGFTKLQERWGSAWKEKVDETILDLRSVYLCPLGQLYRRQADVEGSTGFYVGIRDLGVSDDPAAYGFDIHDDYREWQVLEDAWIQIIHRSS